MSVTKKKVRLFSLEKLKLNVRNIFNDKSNHEKLLWYCEANKRTAQKFVWVFHIKTLWIAEKKKAQTGKPFYMSAQLKKNDMMFSKK